MITKGSSPPSEAVVASRAEVASSDHGLGGQWGAVLIGVTSLCSRGKVGARVLGLSEKTTQPRVSHGESSLSELYIDGCQHLLTNVS